MSGQQIQYIIKSCNGTHNSIASIASHILKDKYVCAAPNGKLWYWFNGTLWIKDESNTNLHYDLSVTIRNYYLSTSPQDFNTHTLTNLQKISFVKTIVLEMREFMYDPKFAGKLDTDRNLIAFTNGVWELKEHAFREARADDYLSISVGYDFTPVPNLEITEKCKQFWGKIHVDAFQREYCINTFARQLYGDTGNLIHIHVGQYAGMFFGLLEVCLGQYMTEFNANRVTVKHKRSITDDFHNWIGCRILYCKPENNQILDQDNIKELAVRGHVLYRLPRANDIKVFNPMCQLHVVCGEPPEHFEASSSRIQMVDYISTEDDNVIFQLESDDYKMEFLRLLLDAYDTIIC